MSNLNITNSKIVHPESFNKLVWGKSMKVYAGTQDDITTRGDEFEDVQLGFKGGFPHYPTVIVQVRERYPNGNYSDFTDVATLDNTAEEYTYTQFFYKNYYFRLKVVAMDGTVIYTNMLNILHEVDSCGGGR